MSCASCTLLEHSIAHPVCARSQGGRRTGNVGLCSTGHQWTDIVARWGTFLSSFPPLVHHHDVSVVPVQGTGQSPSQVPQMAFSSKVKVIRPEAWI